MLGEPQWVSIADIKELGSRGWFPEPHTPGPGPLWLMVLPVVVLVGITLAIGLNAEPIFDTVSA